MQDLKRSRKRFVGKSQIEKCDTVEEISIEEMDRGCKNNHGCKNDNHGCKNENHGCNHDNHHNCKHDEYECEEVIICKKSDHNYHDDCEPCGQEYDNCQKNNCEEGCCGPIMPQKFSLQNSVPYAIEVDRIYDTMKFQVFTDASGPRNKPLYFRYDVVEVNGEIPQRASVNIKIDRVCMNYSNIEIVPGNVSLENRTVTPLNPNLMCEDDALENLCPGFEDASNDDIGQTLFEYNVSGNINKECCNKGKGEKVGYKEKGLRVKVSDLVLELEGKCGCTDVVILAYPTVKMGCEFVDAEYIEFNFNTLTSTMCLPSDGTQVNLRQQFQTALKVECIGKSLLRLNEVDCDEYDYEFCIPNGIDLVCCLEEVVSVLISEQIVVLGSCKTITPRVVDTFTKVCDFSSCGEE